MKIKQQKISCSHSTTTMKSSRGEARRFDAVLERKYAPTMPRATSRLPSEIRHLSGGRGKTNDGLRLGRCSSATPRAVSTSPACTGVLLEGLSMWTQRESVFSCLFRRKWRRLTYSWRREFTTMTPSIQLRRNWIEAKRSHERWEDNDPDPFSSSRCNERPI